MRPIYVVEALKLLKNDYVLEANSEGIHYVFIKEDNKIAIYSDRYNVFVSFNDFLNLYESFIFNPIKDKEEALIDLKKDEEYYSSIQKRQ